VKLKYEFWSFFVLVLVLRSRGRHKYKGSIERVSSNAMLSMKFSGTFEFRYLARESYVPCRVGWKTGTWES